MNKTKIRVCIGSSCFVKGNARNVDRIERFLKAHNISAETAVELVGAGCSRCCADGPVVYINEKRCEHVDAETMERLLIESFPDSAK